MRTNNPTTNPLYFQEYDEIYELHENRYDSMDVEELSFYGWYNQKLMRLADSNDTLRLHLLRESYYKTISYSIHKRSSGSPLSDYQMILQCNALYVRFCLQCRIF